MNVRVEQSAEITEVKGGVGAETRSLAQSGEVANERDNGYTDAAPQGLFSRLRKDTWIPQYEKLVYQGSEQVIELDDIRLVRTRYDTCKEDVLRTIA